MPKKQKSNTKADILFQSVLLIFYIYFMIIAWFRLIGEPILTAPCKEKYGNDSIGIFENNTRMCYIRRYYIFSNISNGHNFYEMKSEYLPYPEGNT